MTVSGRLAPLVFSLALALPPLVTAAAPARWKLAREVPVPQGTVVVAFLDDQRTFSTGCPAPMHRSVDGGKSFSPGYARDLCRYGLEAVPGLVVNVGGGGDVRLSPDVGVHYERGGTFGDAFPHHPRHVSFVDAKRGLVATDEEVGLTTDGGRTWQRLLPPEEAAPVAAVSLAEQRGQLVLRLLDVNGDLWRSGDGGRTWSGVATPLPKGVLPSTKGPTAALRFMGAEGILAATLNEGGGLEGHVYRTTDGGKTWKEEGLSAPFQGAVVTLSVDGRILSAVDGAGTAVKVYRAE
ncbi:MAG TPA: hypothetical protein VEB43_09925 [Anaeromyxobacter sp.]|nr:hypothetical protein [Anaeromyxobacter sp.]